jgi:hypothetical protein
VAIAPRRRRLNWSRWLGLSGFPFPGGEFDRQAGRKADVEREARTSRYRGGGGGAARLFPSRGMLAGTPLSRRIKRSGKGPRGKAGVRSGKADVVRPAGCWTHSDRRRGRFAVVGCRPEQLQVLERRRLQGAHAIACGGTRRRATAGREARQGRRARRSRCQAAGPSALTGRFPDTWPSSPRSRLAAFYRADAADS